MCAHDWQPIPNWYARYRCSNCRAIGCKFGVVVAKYQTRSSEIAPYRCEARCNGERCNEPAVHSLYGKKFRCAAHLHGHAKRGRKELAAAKPVAMEAAAPEARREDAGKAGEVLAAARSR